MKLLVLTNNPSRPSFRQRIEIYLESLHHNGIDYKVVKLPLDRIKRFKLFKQAANFDAVLLHKKCLNFFDVHCLRFYSKKIIYDFDDAIMYSPKKPSSNRTSHFKLFRRTIKLVDLVIAGNQYLAEHAKRFNNNVQMLPTGLDTNEYTAENQPNNGDKIRLVWIGSKSTLKYLKGIKPALEEIGSRFDNIVLRVVCDDFFDLENMEVEKCHWSLKNQAEYLATSDIGLAPLPDNRFTRGKCGFKILQYQAAHLPVVTSPVGVNAEYVTDGVTGYWALDNHQWIDRIGELIGNAKLRKRMANASQRHIDGFDIRAIGSQLCDILTEFVEGARSVDIRLAKPCITIKPKVSICIPTYNRKEYLKETLDSIIAQTYKNYEIVVVDDGSTDGTVDMIKSLDYPVTYCWQKNSGDAAARNKLVEIAQGDYISFIDSDDLLMPDAIEKMVRVMETETEDVIVYGSYYRINQNGKIYGRCKRKLYSGHITKYLFETILVHACGSMFPKKILQNSVVFNTSLKVCSDYDLWLSLSLNYRFIALNSPTFKRRRHLGNLSGPSFENCMAEFEVLRHFYYEKGGKEVIPEKIAMKVFSKESHRIGRCATKEGLHDHALQFCSQSFRQYPNFKSLISWLKAIIAKRLAS